MFESSSLRAWAWDRSGEATCEGTHLDVNANSPLSLARLGSIPFLTICFFSAWVSYSVSVIYFFPIRIVTQTFREGVKQSFRPTRKLDLELSSVDVESDGRQLVMSVDLDALRVRMVTESSRVGRLPLMRATIKPCRKGSHDTRQWLPCFVVRFRVAR